MKTEDNTLYLRDIQDVLELMGGRWRGAIVAALCEGPKRFSVLKKDVGKITPRILIKELRYLEMNLMLRQERSTITANSVVYALTEHGQSFKPVAYELQKWATAHRALVLQNGRQGAGE
jgi:DNA-binding HxlR family transcriptional regulator